MWLCRSLSRRHRDQFCSSSAHQSERMNGNSSSRAESFRFYSALRLEAEWESFCVQRARILGAKVRDKKSRKPEKFGPFSLRWAKKSQTQVGRIRRKVFWPQSMEDMKIESNQMSLSQFFAYFHWESQNEVRRKKWGKVSKILTIKHKKWNPMELKRQEIWSKFY